MVRKKIGLLGVLVVALLAILFAPQDLAKAAVGSYKSAPPPLPGWTHPTAYTDDTPERHGIKLTGNEVTRSSPVIAEIDGNTSDGHEVAIGGDDGMLYVYHADGSLAWSTNVMPSPCSVGVGDAKINSAPAVGAIFGDGVPYVVVSYGTIQMTNCDGGVAAYRGSDGKLQWRFSTRAWAASQGYSSALFGVESSPALADVDGNGKLAVGFGSFDHNIYLLNSDGSVRWYYAGADTVWSSPAFYDINGDGKPEMIIGSDSTYNPNPDSGALDGGFVYAFDTQPRTNKRIEFCFPVSPTCDPVIRWRDFFDQVIYSSPVIGDVLSSNPGNEIVIGSGCFYPFNNGAPSKKPGNWIKILRPSDGAILQTLNAPECVQSSAALGDIFDNGTLAIVANVGSNLDSTRADSQVVAWDPTNPTPKWSTTLHNAIGGNNDPDGGDLQSPVIADLDGNGSLEVISANIWTVHVLNGKTGEPLTCQGCNGGAGLSMFAWYTLKSTPAVGDVNGDGKLDVVIGGGNNYQRPNGHLFGWTGFAGLLNSPAGKQAPYSAPWPMFRGNPQHTGVFQDQTASGGLTVSPKGGQVMLQVQTSGVLQFTIGTGGSNATSLSVTTNDPQKIVASATPPTQGSNMLLVNVTAPETPGVYSATIQLDLPGKASVTIPIQVRSVRQLVRKFLPGIWR